MSGLLLFAFITLALLSINYAVIHRSGTESGEFIPLPLRVLITGFSPFHGAVDNISGDLAAQLNGTCIGMICFEGRVVSVDHAGTSEVMDDLAAHCYWDETRNALSAPWDAIIHLGLEDSAKGLKIEVAAVNVRASEDNAPWSVSYDDLSERNNVDEAVPHAPYMLATSAPLDRLSPESWAHITEEWSRDAGAYFCNEIYFRTLHQVRSRRIIGKREQTGPESARKFQSRLPMIPVIFLHLPLPTEAMPANFISKLVVDLAVELLT